MVREKHRLRPLQVGVARDEHVAMRRSDGERASLRAKDFFTQHGGGVLEPQPHVGRDLVVTAARRVELGRSRNPLGQRLLDVHVHILKLLIPFKPAGLNLGQNRIEARVDRRPLLNCDQAHVRQHRRVGLAAGDVEGREAMVKRDGLAEFKHQFGGAGGETPAPSGL